MGDRLLTRHFLQRFLENDLLSPEADGHDAIAMVWGGLLTLGLFLSVVMSLKFVFMPFQSPGRTALLAIDDRLTFIAIGMIVMALVAVITWDGLSLDPRDTAILGPLPIERGVIVRAKLRAVGLLASGFALAISSLSSLFHPVLMVAKLPIGLLPAFALILIHLTVTLAAALFAFASVVAIREVLRALLGVRFIRISAGVQALLIVALVTSFLLLPVILSRAGRFERRDASMLPPVWFVGLHEALAGGIVAGLPRGALPVSIARQEDRDAKRYRDIAVSIRPLASWAVTALTASLAIASLAFFWNSRRLPLPLAGNRAARYRGPGLFTRVVTLTVARRPATRAGFFFTLQCMFRSGPHRVVMAGCIAASIAVSTVFLMTGSGSPPGDVWSVPVYVFSTQTIALVLLLAGFSHVMRLPADLRASRLFRLACVGDPSRFLAGVRRGAFVGIVLPTILLLLLPHVYLVGTRLALMHALSGCLLGSALISLRTLRMRQLPFVASYAPAGDLNTVGPAVLIGGLIAVSIFSRIERFAMADVGSAAVFWAILAAVIVSPLAARRNMLLDLPTAFDVPATGATRLDLG
ncbi:MAG: hypothetical protein V7647_3970 [Acidobacteriota bacterium]